MLREIKEAIYGIINSWYFDQDKMAEIILKELCKHITTKELKGSEVTFEFVDELTEEEVMTIEFEEKGSTKEGEVLAITIADNPDVFKIVFVFNAIKRFIETMNPFEVKDIIEGIAKHEAFHVRQYNYMIKKGGMDAIGRFAEYSRKNHYEQNILEEGAVNYQYFDEEQDFSIFDQFVKA